MYLWICSGLSAVPCHWVPSFKKGTSCASAIYLHKLDIYISVWDSLITFGQHAHCLGVMFDLSFMTYIQSHERSCQFVERAKTFIVALISSRLNHWNSLLISPPFSKLSPIQSVLNAAARPIFLSNRYTDASTLCHSLDWLPVNFNLQFKCLTKLSTILHLPIKQIFLGRPTIISIRTPFLLYPLLHYSLEPDNICHTPCIVTHSISVHKQIPAERLACPSMCTALFL